jgi:hypothetical protein
MHFSAKSVPNMHYNALFMFRAHGVRGRRARVFVFADRVRSAAALRRLKDIAAPRHLNLTVPAAPYLKLSSPSNICEISTEDIVDGNPLLTYISTQKRSSEWPSNLAR